MCDVIDWTGARTQEQLGRSTCRSASHFPALTESEGVFSAALLPGGPCAMRDQYTHAAAYGRYRHNHAVIMHAKQATPVFCVSRATKKRARTHG